MSVENNVYATQPDEKNLSLIEQIKTGSIQLDSIPLMKINPNSRLKYNEPKIMNQKSQYSNHSLHDQLNRSINSSDVSPIHSQSNSLNMSNHGFQRVLNKAKQYKVSEAYHFSHPMSHYS